MSFFASLKEKFQNFKTEFKRSCEEATRKEEERQKAAQQAKKKKKNTPYDNYKESHPQIQITDMDGNLFSWSWEKPIIIYFYEQILKRDDDVLLVGKGDDDGNIMDEKRQQVFLHTVKQIDREHLEITGFSFVDKKGRFFKINSIGKDVPCILYDEIATDPENFFERLKELYNTSLTV